MAKAPKTKAPNTKAPKTKEAKGVQNRHIYSRASYLYQAAAYLTSQQQRLQDDSTKSESADQQHGVSAPSLKEQKALQNVSRHLISECRAVSLKAQIRQSRAMKRSICKFCNTLQVEGQTCTSTIENLSKGGKKPWADVLVIKCETCGNVKRYPVSAPRQKRRDVRKAEQENSTRASSTTCITQEATPDTGT